MAQKPRVKAPKKREAPKSRDGSDRRLLLVSGAIAAVAIAVAAGGFFVLAGTSAPNSQGVRTDLEAAGCTLQAVKAVKGAHTLTPDGTSPLWNTDPPTSGPHFGFNPDGTPGTVIWGSYTEPVQLARVVHNLEHGGIYILYGDKVSKATVAQLQTFYENHRVGTVMAPYPKLGAKIALGAWVQAGSKATGYLAKCPSFSKAGFDSFFSAFHFHGPEPYPASSLLPGSN
jgi:hypothetical protein